MNEIWTAVLADGKVTLHLMEDSNQQDIKFPQNQGESAISQIRIAGDFLIMLDAKGKLMYYTVEDQAQLIEYTTDNPIVAVFPNAMGTRCVCIDNTGNGTLYNPIDNTSIMVPNFQATTRLVLWDQDDKNVFLTVDKEKMLAYLYTPLTLEGPQVKHLTEYLKLD